LDAPHASFVASSGGFHQLLIDELIRDCGKRPHFPEFALFNYTFRE
jgi:hypothetical protein